MDRRRGKVVCRKSIHLLRCHVYSNHSLRQLCRQIHKSCSPSSNADVVVQLLPDLLHVSSPVGASTANRKEQDYLWASVAVGKQ